jgi:hypothetical protein
MLSWGIVMLYDSASPHTATTMQDLIATLGWEQFDHPPYGSDLVSSDLHVFLHLKTFLRGQWFHNNEVREAVNTWFASQGYKLMPRHNKCLNNGGNYVKK